MKELRGRVVQPSLGSSAEGSGSSVRNRPTGRTTGATHVLLITETIREDWLNYSTFGVSRICRAFAYSRASSVGSKLKVCAVDPAHDRRHRSVGVECPARRESKFRPAAEAGRSLLPAWAPLLRLRLGESLRPSRRKVYPW